MKAKIGNRTIDSKDQPIMIILDQEEKDLLRDMDPKAFCFCVYPVGSRVKEIEQFMEGSVENRSNPFHLGILNQEQFDDLTEWQRMDRRVKELERQNKNLREAYADQKVKLDEYRETCGNHHNFMSESEIENKSHWCWKWGEENHLESLSCPILIPAVWFRTLIQEAKDGGSEFLNGRPKVDPNQLTMSIDNNVVIVNTFQARD